MATQFTARNLTRCAGGIAILIGVGLAVGNVAPYPPEQVQPAPSVAAPQARTDTQIEFSWPAETSTDVCWLVIGSLDEAATRTMVRIQPLSTVTQDGTLAFAPVQGQSRTNPGSVRVASSSSSIRLANWNVPQPSSIEVRPAARAMSRNFFLQTAPNRHQPVMTRLAAESERVRIWEEDAGEAATPSIQLVWLIEQLEQEILPKLTELYGEIADIDGDGKLAVCLTDRLSELPTTDSPVEGLVQVDDFHADLPRPQSNQADVVFLSRALQPGPHALAVMAHEAAHLAVFSRRFEADPHGFRPEDDWLNEGLAHFAEVECSGSWTNLSQRIAAFQDHPESSPLVVIDAHRAGFWRDPGSRGAAWSFLSWLADQSGPEMVSELARHPNVGCAKIEAVLQEPFEDVFRRWTVAQATANSPANGVGGNQSEIVLCGTGHYAWRITKLDGARSGWRITAPAGSRIQSTLVDPSAQPPRTWIIR